MDDPGIRPCTPRCSPLLSSRPVVVLAQVLLSRPWHRGGPASLRGFSEKVGSARLQLRLLKHQAAPRSNHATSSLNVNQRFASNLKEQGGGAGSV